MGERKGLSKKVRFEVFKRDNFTCAYCGRNPPAVVLQVDHIVAVAVGGENDPANLTTACFDCNSGKSDRPLSVASPKLIDQAEKRKELAEQMRAYAEAAMEAREAEEGTVKIVEDAWFRALPKPGNDRRWEWSDERLRSIRGFLDRLSVPEILQAIDITHRSIDAGRVPRPEVFKVDDGWGLHDEKAFRYLCGVCWRTIKGEGSYP